MCYEEGVTCHSMLCVLLTGMIVGKMSFQRTLGLLCK